MPNGKLSRRTFVLALGSAAAAALLPGSLSSALADGMIVEPQIAGAELTALAAVNSNVRRLRSAVGTPAMKENVAVWVESREDGSLQAMQYAAETPLEIGEATEFHEMATWRSWRTEQELKSLLQKGRGQWLIRMNLSGRFSLLTTECAQDLLREPPIDIGWFVGAFTSHIKEAARVTAAQALQLVTCMSATFEPYGCAFYFEPIKPRDAFVDLRMGMLRKTGWGPQTYAAYDLTDLDRIFRSPQPIRWLPERPFARVPDGFLALFDMSKHLGPAEFSDPSLIWWWGQCPHIEEPDHDNACDCLPREMRSATSPALIHMFARKDSNAKFTYLGLGHADCGVRGDSAPIRLVPALRNEIYESLGGHLGWELKLSDDANARVLAEAVRDAQEIERLLDQIDTVNEGSLMLGRWSGSTCIAEWRGAYGILHVDRFVRGRRHREFKYCTNPAYAGDPSGYLPLTDNNVPAIGLIPRHDMIDLIKLFYHNDGELPWPERWVDDLHEAMRTDAESGKTNVARLIRPPVAPRR